MAEIQQTAHQVPASQERYTLVAITLHWVIAAAIIFQLGAGFWMVRFARTASESQFLVYQIHKTVGLTILALSLARLVWRLAHSGPPLPAGMAPYERAIANSVHVAFYVLMIAVPLSGWIMVSVSVTHVPTQYFLQSAWPFAHLPLPSSERLEDLAKASHEYLAIATGLLLLMHAAAALKHQFLDRDQLLGRMTPGGGRKPGMEIRGPAALVALILALGFLVGGIVVGRSGSESAAIAERSLDSETARQAVDSADVSGSDTWLVDPASSQIDFRFIYQDQEMVGQFETWTAQIRFNPAAPETGSATVEIDMQTVSLSNPSLTSQVTAADYFYTKEYATASFTVDGFQQTAPGEYVADGILTIRDVSKPVVLPFTFVETAEGADVRGVTEINRLDFNIGAAGAADEKTLKYSVEIEINLKATRQT